MKAVEIRDKFGVNSLNVVERPDPVPGPNQVVLKMNAFSINYRDLLVVNGVGRWRPPLPRVPLSDGVGIVAATGTGVSRVKLGDRVAPIFYPKWLEGRVAAEKMGHALGGAAANGVLAEYTLFDEASLVHVPPHLTDEEGTPLPPSGLLGPAILLRCSAPEVSRFSPFSLPGFAEPASSSHPAAMKSSRAQRSWAQMPPSTTRPRLTGPRLA